ncbi:hypothetical protein M514_02254 [Trichuris suis]|uniref:Uncharacterized protein n=1 Tax=Trichuris suis TaxID=68888 RepID=A0A085NKU9_9BILA|nr:hypothetical protein M513_02254 [Trichuris suis]KFD70095.1 hypothetical protein M514_02254 [Trichuris suis]KHJ47278.1 hypothetical protein D918_02138 [Trichuris suis]
MRSIEIGLLQATLSLFLCGCASSLNTARQDVNTKGRQRRHTGNVWSSHGAWSEMGLPRFWESHKHQYFGVVIRGWQYSKCVSERWRNHAVNVKKLVIWPEFPRFPGPIFFNATLTVEKDLPQTGIELELELRHAVKTSTGQKYYEVIPCYGWDMFTGCGGVGSCRYCNVLDQCRDAVQVASKYMKNDKLRRVLQDPSKVCPPPKGEWSITFSMVFRLKDLPDGFFGPLQSNEYWLTFTFNDGHGQPLTCGRIWLDICKYRLNDREQKCLRDDSVYSKFISTLG